MDRNRMSAFLQGYETAGGVSLARLGPADAAKRVAALAGWFVFMGKRALGDYDDSISERLEARHEALRTLDRLRLTLQELPRWLEV